MLQMAYVGGYFQNSHTTGGSLELTDLKKNKNKKIKIKKKKAVCKHFYIFVYFIE